MQEVESQPSFDVSSFSQAALQLLIDSYENKIKDLDARVEKAAEDEDYDLAEELQEELEQYQNEEAPKVELAKKRIQELQNN